MIHLLSLSLSLSLPPFLIPFVLPDATDRSTNRYVVDFNRLTDYQAGAVRIASETATTLWKERKKERTFKRSERKVIGFARGRKHVIQGEEKTEGEG